jgi:hypothetical protein
MSHLFRVDTTLTSGLSGFGLDVKVDEEKNGKESSKSNGKVGTELDLKGNRVGGKRLDDRFHSKSRGSESGNGQGTEGGNLVKGNLRGNCRKNQDEKSRVSAQYNHKCSSTPLRSGRD